MQKILDMYMGNTMPGYVSIDCFMALVCPLMEKLRPQAEDLLDQVYQILKQIGIFYLQKIFSNKEALKDALSELYVDLLTASKDNCQVLMTSFMDCQTKTIFTKDPLYITDAYTWPEDENRIAEAPQSKAEKKNLFQKAQKSV